MDREVVPVTVYGLHGVLAWCLRVTTHSVECGQCVDWLGSTKILLSCESWLVAWIAATMHTAKGSFHIAST